MCQECGCGIVREVQINGSTDGESPAPPAGSTALPSSFAEAHDAHASSSPHDHEHPHSQNHEHEHGVVQGHPHTPHTVEVHQAILTKNDRLAERNRGFFQAKKLLVLNVVSAPGSGKTTFIEKTARTLGERLRIGAIVGDLATDNDASRLRAAGVPTVQINTGTACHLEADMVARAANRIELDKLDLLIIENVGNLVCPAMYDLGEELRVVLLSTTEGEDKPLKYPPMFHSAQVAIVTKIDLAAAAGFDRDAALANLRRISHHATVFEVSSRTGEGMETWCQFLLARREA
ncbi:MAG: hydrogenase nickel incorporation protein HypB [Verrucomicrobia bacterium]|nr:hydrogenase nickel incorporation protein HypB [Verrucomicrobiota bacterium]